MKKKKKTNPDVMLYHSYTGGHKVHIHIVPFETEDFPHGLELVDTFSDPNVQENTENAEKFATKVQKYVDLLRLAPADAEFVQLMQSPPRSLTKKELAKFKEKT